jgi:hypothetical protein
MPRLLRGGVVGLALSAHDLWRRLPPEQRKRLIEQARKHGPRLAQQAAKTVRAARTRKF